MTPWSREWIFYNTRIWDSIEGSKTGLHGGERKVISDISRKSDAGGRDDVSEDGKLGDTAVLGLDSSQAIESCLVSILEETQGVPEAKRRLSTNLRLKGHLQRRRPRRADRGKGRGANKGSKDNESSEPGMETKKEKTSGIISTSSN